MKAFIYGSHTFDFQVHNTHVGAQKNSFLYNFFYQIHGSLRNSNSKIQIDIYATQQKLTI